MNIIVVIIMKVMMMFFIRPGHLLIILVTILQQQSRALPQLRIESSSTTTDWDLLPSYTFQSYSTAIPSPTLDFKNNPMTTKNPKELTSSVHTSIEISNGNFNKMTIQKHSVTEDSTRFLSMTSTPSSIGFYPQLSRIGCFSSHCRFEPSSSFITFGTAIPILGRPASNQLTPDSSSRRILSGSPLAGPTSAIKTSSPGFIIMADTTATTMASQQRLKRKKNKKRKRKKRKKKRKKKKSRRKGRRTTVEWEVEELRKTTRAATTEKNIRVKWVADHRRRDQNYPAPFPTAITRPSLLKSVSFLAPVQRHVPLSSFPAEVTTQPMPLPGVAEKPFPTIKATPVFKEFSIKKTMTFPNLLSSGSLQDQLIRIKPHPLTTMLSLTAETSHHNESNQDHLHTASFTHPSTKNQIPTPIANSNTQESINPHNYVTTSYFVAKSSSESTTISQKLNPLSSSFSFHSIHKSDFSELQSSLSLLNTQLGTTFSSLKDFPNPKDIMFQSTHPIMSSNMKSLHSFSQIKIPIQSTQSEQRSLPHSATNQMAYVNSTNSMNSTKKYRTLESILIFEARRPPIIEKSFEIDKQLTTPRFIDNSEFQSFPQIYSSNSFVEPELSQNVFSTVSEKSVSKTQFSSSLTPLSVSDVSENLKFMDLLAVFDTVLNSTKENSSVSEELSTLSTSSTPLVSSTPFLSNSVFPLSFHSQIIANHERTRKFADEDEQPLSSRETASKNHLPNNSEHFSQISFQSNSLDQSVYPSFSSDSVSNPVPSSKFHPQFTKESVEAKSSSFVDSLNPTIISPGDLFSDFTLTDSGQSLSWPDIHSTTLFNDLPSLQTSSLLTFDQDPTHTPLLEEFTFEPLVIQHNPQTLGDEKNFNLVFDSEKRQNLKHPLIIPTSTTDVTASSITNNLIPSASLHLSLEQEPRRTSMSSYSQENIISDNLSQLPTMMSTPESSYDLMDILSSSFHEILSTDLTSSETSLGTTTPNMALADMSLESSMLSITSSNKLSLSLAESYSKSLSSELTTEGSSNMASITDDSINTLFSTPESSNLFFPSTGVTPDSWTAPALLTVDSGTFTTDSNSQLHVLVDRDLTNHTTSDADKGTNPTTPLTITLPTTPEPLLNLSQAFQNYWVITVIKVRLSVNVTTMAFRREMERNLAQAYVEAYHRGERILNGTYQPLRKKRFALMKDVALQMINITRSQTKSSNNVTLVYYMEKRGKPVPAISAARHLMLLQPQELAIYLKQVVVLPARTYLKPPHPEPSKDWIIGAVLGTLSSALLLIWCILFIYFKCFHMRPTKSIHTKSPTPQLVLSTSMQDINTDTSETVLIRDEMQVQRQPSLLKKNGPKKQTYSVVLPKVGRKNKREPEREVSEREITGGKKKGKSARKAINGKISKKAEVKPEVKINGVNNPPKQNGHVVMEQNEYSKETDNYSDYEVEPPIVQMLPPLSINGCISNERLSPFHYVNLPPIQHNFSLTASRQEPFPRYVPQSSSDYMADDELRHQADHLRRIQKQRLKEERRKMRHVELYQNSPHYFLTQDQDMEVVGSSLRTETADESHLEESRRGSRRRRYKRREKHDMSSQEDSSLNDAYDHDETWANQPEMLQRTRQKMHKLLDDYFQLIAKPERKKVSSSITPLGTGCTRRSSIGKRRTRRQRTNLLETPTVSCHRKSSPSDSAPEEKLDRLHTPLFLHNHYSPCNRHRVNSAIPPPWNAAGDEAAKIAAEHQAWSSPYVSPRLNRSNTLLDSSDPREEMRVPTINYPSDHNLTEFGCQPSFSFSRTRLSSQFSPYASSRQMFHNRHSGYHSVDNSDDTPTSLFQATTPCCPTNIETNIELNTFEPPSFAKHLSRSPGSSKTSPVDDEIDVIHNIVKQESSPQPLIQSIREELLRLSNEKGERNSLRSRIVFS